MHMEEPVTDMAHTNLKYIYIKAMSALSSALLKSEQLHERATSLRLEQLRHAAAEIDRLAARLDAGKLVCVKSSASAGGPAVAASPPRQSPSKALEAVAQLVSKAKARLHVVDAPIEVAPPPPSSATAVAAVPVTTGAKHGSADAWVNEAMARRAQHGQALDQAFKPLSKNKLVTQCKLHLTMLTATVRDVRARLDGTPAQPGPRALLAVVRQKSPEQVAAVAHVVADKCVNLVMGNTAPDAIRYGETNYALAYTCILTCARHAEFTTALRSALEFHCPYVVPGLKARIEAMCHADGSLDRRRLLGYQSDDESDADYVLRMQAIVAFYAALLQTSVETLLVFDASATHNPWTLAEAWHFLAGTLNASPWRWTRPVLQAFLAVAGAELGAVAGKQMIKLAKVCVSAAFTKACDKLAMRPDDDDRLAVFAVALKETIARGYFAPPGKPSDEGKDPRVLPDDVTQNVG